MKFSLILILLGLLLGDKAYSETCVGSLRFERDTFILDEPTAKAETDKKVVIMHFEGDFCSHNITGSINVETGGGTFGGGLAQGIYALDLCIFSFDDENVNGSYNGDFEICSLLFPLPTPYFSLDAKGKEDKSKKLRINCAIIGTPALLAEGKIASMSVEKD
jgi:hypothetical protein